MYTHSGSPHNVLHRPSKDFIPDVLAHCLIQGTYLKRSAPGPHVLSYSWSGSAFLWCYMFSRLSATRERANSVKLHTKLSHNKPSQGTMSGHNVRGGGGGGGHCALVRNVSHSAQCPPRIVYIPDSRS